MGGAALEVFLGEEEDKVCVLLSIKAETFKFNKPEDKSAVRFHTCSLVCLFTTFLHGRMEAGRTGEKKGMRCWTVDNCIALPFTVVQRPRFLFNDKYLPGNVMWFCPPAVVRVTLFVC